jgi:twitching motility two-component system response regulator PilH
MAVILIVDDSPTELHLFKNMLEKSGFETLVADSGEEGIRQASTSRPDCILMDVVMPGMNGFQATRAITEDPATKHIPVFIVTTKGQETDKIWGARQGAKDYIVKPVNGADLLAKIASLG